MPDPNPYAAPNQSCGFDELMRSDFNWRGHLIHIELQPFGFIAWLGIGFVVTVYGKRFLPGSVFECFTTKTEFHFEHGGTTHHGLVRSLGIFHLPPVLDYAVSIDGEVLARGHMRLRRGYLTLAATTCLIFAIAFALIFAAYLLIRMFGLSTS